MRPFPPVLLILVLLGTACTDPPPHTDTPSVAQVDVNGQTFTYRVEGTGIPCLVIGGAVSYPRAFSPTFKQHLRCAFIDTRMTTPHAAAAPDTGLTLAQVVDDVEAIRQALGLDEVVVVGQSVNGLIALEYARRVPEAVRGVIAVAPPASWNAATVAAQQVFWESTAHDARKAQHEANWRRLRAPYLDGQDADIFPLRGDVLVMRYLVDAARIWHDPAYDAAWLFADAPAHLPAFAAFFASLHDYDFGAGPQPIRAPVLLALGRSDYLIPYPQWNAHRARFEDLHMQWFEASGHWPMIEEPVAFDAAMQAWLTRLAG